MNKDRKGYQYPGLPGMGTPFENEPSEENKANLDPTPITIPERVAITLIQRASLISFVSRVNQVKIDEGKIITVIRKRQSTL